MREGRVDSVSVVGAAGAVIAVACCAGLPAVGALLGGLTAVAVLGVAGGLLVAVGAVAVALFAVRARRGCQCAPSRKAAR